MEEIKLRYHKMQRYVDWSQQDAARMAEIEPLLAPHAQELIGDFYDEIQRHADASNVITGGASQIERLSRTLLEWLAQLLGGRYDDLYMERRWRVGQRHVQIGLPQRFTSLALGRLRAGMTRILCDNWRGSSEGLTSALISLNKLLDLDHALIQDAYESQYVEHERMLERERGERKFRHLVENASCLIAIIASDDSIAYFNPFAQKVTGYAASELRGQPDKMCAVLGGDSESLRDQLSSVRTGRETACFDVQIAKSGTPARCISWTFSAIENAGVETLILAVGQDVTEQKRSVEQQLKSSRLEAIGEMYARIAHESRNSLQRLQVCSELLAEELTGNEACLRLVERSAQAQGDLHRLLDEVRSYAAPIALEKTECRLSALWQEAWNLLEASRKGRDAALVAETAAGAMRPMLLDRFRIVQVFRNIFENSLMAGADPLKLRIRCYIREYNNVSMMEVRLCDNGPGFGPGAIDQAFQPFFTTRSRGSGLGLAIVRRIVEAHGGSVGASNATGGGAEITILLPLKEMA